MRESSATDGSPVNTQPLDFGFRRLENRHPGTLDSGFPAGMTALWWPADAMNGFVRLSWGKCECVLVSIHVSTGQYRDDL
jgi:hypothetical protein